MTFMEFRAARQVLHMTAKQFAENLGVVRASTIRVYESRPTGSVPRTIPKTIQKLVRAMLAGYDPINDTISHRRIKLYAVNDSDFEIRQEGASRGKKPKTARPRLRWAWDKPKLSDPPTRDIKDQNEPKKRQGAQQGTGAANREID